MSAIRVLMRLRELLDVLVSSPADGDVLTYETASSKWKNLPAAGGGSQPSLPLDLGPGRFEVDAHGNTTISSDDPGSGDVLLLVSPVGNTAGLSIKTEGLDPCFQAGTDGSVDIRSGDGTTEGLVVFPNAAAAEYAAGLKVYKPNGNDMGFRVFANGQVGIIDNAPIGDDNLALGELVISYDATTGTVHFKGMLADTSIKTATIVLT